MDIKTLFLIPGIFLLISCTSEQQTEIANGVEFENFFTLQDKITVKEDSIFSVKQVLPRDSVLYLLDQEVPQVLVIDQKGNLIEKVGGRGTGPEEFADPVWLGDGPRNNFFVIDAGNNRVSIFEDDGALLKAFGLRSPGPFTGSYALSENNILITNTAYCVDKPGQTCVFQVYDLQGNRVRTFGEIRNIDTESPGVPFHSTLSNDSLLYVQHSLGSRMSVFGLQGEKQFDFSTEQSPLTHPLDVQSLPSDVYEQVKTIKASSYTHVTGIFSFGDYILIQFRRSGEKFEDNTTFFLELYNRQGDLEYYGLNTNYKLVGVDSTSLYFLQSNLDVNESSYIIYHYSINERQ